MTLAIPVLLACFAAALPAADWPEWRGTGRQGVWQETGILDKFPESGLRVKWRTPIGSGFSGFAVARAKVFLLDFQKTGPNQGLERAPALDEKTGSVFWTRRWESDYTGP